MHKYPPLEFTSVPIHQNENLNAASSFMQSRVVCIADEVRCILKTGFSAMAVDREEMHKILEKAATVEGG